MTTRPSPLFSINGQPVGLKVSLSANTVYTATLDDITGVSPVTWTAPRTDDTTTTSTYEGEGNWAQSGSVGQTQQFKTAGAGTAGVLKVTVKGGTDPVTGKAQSPLMSAEVKFYVPTAGGLEPVVAGEFVDGDNVSDPTHGAAVPINAAIRNADSQVSAESPPVVDNTIMRWHLTGGLKAQASPVTIDDTGSIVLPTGQSISLGTTVSAAGTIRGPDVFSVVGFGGGGDVAMIAKDAGDNVLIGANTAQVTGVFFDCIGGTGLHTFRIGGSIELIIGPNTSSFKGPLLINDAGSNAVAGDIRGPDVFGISAFGGAGDISLIRKDATDAVFVGDDKLTLTSALVTAAVPVVVPSFAVAGIPSASPAAQLIFVTDDAGGATLAYSDGTNFRRVSDRTIVAV